MSESRRAEETPTKETKRQRRMRILEDIFVVIRIIAFERYSLFCRKQRKNKTLENIPGNSRKNETLEQIPGKKESYEYATRLEKGMEHSDTMKTNPF